jgi:hypothetical protein
METSATTTEPNVREKCRESLRMILRLMKLRTKQDPRTGKEYIDPPFTAEECDLIEQQLLAIHQQVIPNPYNLPPPTNILESLYRIAPEDVPPEFRITPHNLKNSANGTTQPRVFMPHDTAVLVSEPRPA